MVLGLQVDMRTVYQSSNCPCPKPGEILTLWVWDGGRAGRTWASEFLTSPPSDFKNTNVLEQLTRFGS